MDNKKHYTVTMADLYFKQGYYDEAKEIYLYLQKEKLNNLKIKHISSKIEEISNVLNKENTKSLDKQDKGSNISSLLEKWFSLKLKLNKIEHMKNLKKHINDNAVT